MKRCLVFSLLLLFFSSSFATDYYSKTGQTNPNALSSWNTSPAGVGSAPTNFIGAGHRFIIQSGHTMTTTSTWTIGSATTFLVIQNGGTLWGNHRIQLTGTFQIDNGGTYIHNNNDELEQSPAGFSIYAATASFAPGSNFEIRNWFSPGYGLPSTPVVTWGNLIINLQIDMGVNWNWKLPTGTTLNINGNLDIRSTSSSGLRELQLCWDAVNTINVTGDLLVSGTSKLAIKKTGGTTVSGSMIMTVDGNITMTGTSSLHLGLHNPANPSPTGNYELRYKGNLSATSANTITSGTKGNCLVACGTSPQTLTAPPLLNCSYRVAPGATVNLASATNFGNNVLGPFDVLGTFNTNGYSFGCYQLSVAAGTFNSTGNVLIDNICTACTGNGTIGYSSGWCGATGTKGKINFTTGPVIIGNGSVQAHLRAGHLTNNNSPGEIYFANTPVTLVTPSISTVSMNAPNSILSLDGTSYIQGTITSFDGKYGTLRIGSPDGITATGNITTGNIRISGSKMYNSQGQTNFEYFGTSAQVTGVGLPTTIAGALKINNSAGINTTGVTLSQNTTVSGTVNLASGRLTTTAATILTMSDGATYTGGSLNSFVNGPMKKIGDDNFSFPIGFGDGSGNIYAPLGIINTGGENTGDEFTAEYKRANPQNTNPYSSAHDAFLDHVSYVEYWTLQQNIGTAAKQVSLDVHLASFCKNLAKTYVSRWNGSQWTYEASSITSGPAIISGYETGIIQSTGGISGLMSPNIAITLSTDLPVSNNPLPIDLISFDATKLANTKSSINWELAAFCSAAARFEIEKDNGNNRNFYKIAVVNGSTTNKLYNYIDNDLKTSINYYRLKMIDEDGKITYSRTVAVMNGVNGLLLTSLIPTMVTNTTILTVASSRQQKLDIVIADMQGRAVLKRNYTITAGNTNIELSLGGLAAGVYQLTGISADGKTNTIRFIK